MLFDRPTKKLEQLHLIVKWLFYTFQSILINSAWPEVSPILANTYVLGIIDGTYVGMWEDTGTI